MGTATSGRRRRTYMYKLTSDRGGAPCAPEPVLDEPALLTLSICKPAIRRTAQAGDRLLGITSQSLVRTDGYPANAVIYAAIVEDAIDAREYYGARSRFRHRPDCIYQFHQSNGRMEHSGRTPLHADPGYRSRDIGEYPFYKNGRTLLSRDFRYFGAGAVALPERLYRLEEVVSSLGQGHRVFTEKDPEQTEIDALFRVLWKRVGLHTPGVVTDEAYGHTPRQKKIGTRVADADRVCCAPQGGI